MREMFEDMFREPIDPMESARRGMRPPLRGRFYRTASAGEEEGGSFPVLLDGRPVRTPARRLLAAPTEPLAADVAAEWEAQQEVVDPARMPLTRLANTIIDGVCDAVPDVASEVTKYIGSDLLFYRADQPEGLVREQTLLWDPVLAWAHEALGARFILTEGVVFTAQPDRALAAVAAAVPREPWRLGAVHSITTLTGSALLALAVLRARLTAEAAWTAAHVDEDWNIAQWGRDELALARRAYRWEEMRAAATVLDHLR
ncbi:MAG TPA: ATP12 family protein [Xanthobacteraceae bacterium]|nr:ATP12 family protein [Xanthobacteraceae bacterium]